MTTPDPIGPDAAATATVDPEQLARRTADVERTTQALVEDVELPGGLGTLALVRLDNGTDGAKPATLGPNGLLGIGSVLREQQWRAHDGRIVALAVTGTGRHLAAGADLGIMGRVTSPAEARTIARLGQDTYRLLSTMGVPTFAYVNGTALGGGLELALHCTYRTVASDVRALGLPETYLGLVPGWGGCTLLPRLVGVEAALDLVLTRPLANNRRTDATTAGRIGLADVVLPAEDFLDRSLAWTAEVLAGRVDVARRPPEDAATWAAVVDGARRRLDRRLHGARRAPYLALDLVAGARDADLDAAFAAEEDALTELLLSEELRAGLYAFDLMTRLARSPEGAPDEALARPVRAVGIVGAGLMARQLAVLVATRLGVPVALTEVDEDRAEAGRAGVRALVADLAARGRLTEAEAQAVLASVTVGTDVGALAGADLVVEAVTEVMEVKKAVLAGLDGLVDDRAVLATNTSALSVAGMAADLRRPERVVGLHFFNPVAQMPLVEVVRAERSGDEAVATAFAVAKALGKTAVGVGDRPGFVVNRLLLRMLAEVAAAVEDGTGVEVADRALRPLGLPMGPFALMQLVGLPVALHVLRSLHEGLGDRYRLSPGLERLAAEGRRVVPEPDGAGAELDVDPAIQSVFGEPGRPGSLDEAGVLNAVLRGLTEEVGLILEEGVAAGPEQVDLCMLLGAGWPLHLGGITPHLDRSGWSERLLGRRLHPQDAPGQ